MAHSARTGYSTNEGDAALVPLHLVWGRDSTILPIGSRIRVFALHVGQAGGTGRARAVDTGQRAALRSDGLMRWNAAFYPALERGEWGGGSVGGTAWRDQDAAGGGGRSGGARRGGHRAECPRRVRRGQPRGERPAAHERLRDPSQRLRRAHHHGGLAGPDVVRRRLGPGAGPDGPAGADQARRRGDAVGDLRAGRAEPGRDRPDVLLHPGRADRPVPGPARRDAEGAHRVLRRHQRLRGERVRQRRQRGAEGSLRVLRARPGARADRPLPAGPVAAGGHRGRRQLPGPPVRRRRRE